jgi:hypothetical protein
MGADGVRRHPISFALGLACGVLSAVGAVVAADGHTLIGPLLIVGGFLAAVVVAVVAYQRRAPGDPL